MNVMKRIVITLLLVALPFALMSIPDLCTKMLHMTPGAARYHGYSAYTYSSYRVNADSTVTFKDRWTDTWLTLPRNEMELFPRATWWWQRLVPPKEAR